MINTGKLAGKTLYITGASRGIGKAIALKAAKDGAKIVVAAKTAEPHPKLPGTIFTAAKEIEEAGGKALPCVVDVRDENSVQESIEKAVKHFGGIDIVINNASAISLTGTEHTSMKKYDLMHQINTRGTYLVSKLAIPYLRSSKNNPHILNISPPLNMSPRWFRDHCAYTMAKYGMSMCVLGMSEEFKDDRIAVNALWPKTAIITAAMEMLGGGKEVAKQCRLPDIMADAAYVMLNRDCKSYTGNFAIDEEVLKEEGCRDFDKYASEPGHPLMPDFFLDEFDSFMKSPPRGMGGASGAKSARTTRAFHTFAPLRSSAAPPTTYSSVPQVFDRIEAVSSEKIVSQVQAIYLFDVENEGKYFIDFKNGTGTVGKGEPKDKPDVTFNMNIDNFLKIFNRELSPASAFMTGKIKVKGDLSKALTLEKVMKAAAEAAVKK